MKKKIQLLLSLGCLSLICFGASACSSSTLPEKYEKKGYVISVTYDANGGDFMNRDGVSVMDMFNPSHFEADGNDEIHIKLTEPTDEIRESGSKDNITLGKEGHFLAGWYTNRQVLTNTEGQVIDEAGTVLYLQEDGSYAYAETDENGKPKKGTPAYTYSGYWDFENDTIDYKLGTGKTALTLYAGWVPFYEFHYYYEKDGEWTYYAKTTFDYKKTNEEGSKEWDQDTIFTPQWTDGAVQYAKTYENKETYNFPKPNGTTFVKAYQDPERTVEIGESWTHAGTLDQEKGEAVDRIQNVYVDFVDGEQYRIETAKQLEKHVNLKGHYEIKADLDFSGEDVSWPAAFVSGKFEGKMFSTAGHTFKIKNPTAVFSSSTDTKGGLFGSVAAGAEIKNLVFENVTTDIESVTGRLPDFKLGLFAGEIEESATLENVTVGGLLRLGKVTFLNGYSINLLTNSEEEVAGLTATEIKLQVYGQDLGEFMPADQRYLYSVDPNGVTVDAVTGTVTVTPATLQKQESFYNINIA